MNTEVETPSNETLVAAILPDPHREALRPSVRRLFAVPEFSHFVRNHETTIASELRKQKTVEDCLDVVAELEFACLLSPYVEQFEYQFKLTGSNKCLDFVLHFSSSGCVGAEVKRIREPDSLTKRYGNDRFEIPYTQRESFKFTDRILEALPQLHPQYPNVVFFQISSSTHEPDDAFEALAHVVAHFRQGNDEFFTAKDFQSREHFLEQYRKLSAVLVRSRFTPVAGAEPINYTRNRILINQDANLTIPEDVADVLRHADIGT
jgi:hypothetical protein